MALLHTNKFKTADVGFVQKINQLKIDDLPIDAYCKRYLQHLQKNATYYCTIYQQICNTVLKNTTLQKATIGLLDYGAGNGLLGIYAKFIGFKSVYINDINPTFIKASQVLAKALNIHIDGFIAGDISDVANYFNSSTLHTMVSFDVIEHIYNLPQFFKTIQAINPSIITVFGTGVNAHNPFKNHYFKQLQIKDELHGGQPSDFVLYGATATPPFIETRKLLIQNFSPALSTNEINMLAIHTRGLHKADIELATNSFLLNKKLPPLLQHSTNTCDPLTGSWTERLFTLKQYRKIYNTAEFSLHYHNGFYNQYNPTFKSKIMAIANFILPIFGVIAAPYILLVGKR